MEAVGIICEYNPLHNGHIYHIKQVKKLFPGKAIILVLNGYFLERGEVSILSKENKTKLALIYGVDLVVELPFIYGTQSADIFADAAIKILGYLGCSYLVFGSESNNVEILEKVAAIEESAEDIFLLLSPTSIKILVLEVSTSKQFPELPLPVPDVPVLPE